jgi:hypothetical protein
MEFDGLIAAVKEVSTFWDIMDCMSLYPEYTSFR